MCNLKLVIWDKEEKISKEILIENPLYFSCGTNPVFAYLRENYVEVHVLSYQTIKLDFGKIGESVTVKIVDGVR